MSRLEPEEVRQIARLAGLDLSEREVERLAEEMGTVLGHFVELEASGVAGTAGVQQRGLQPRTRADVPSSDPLLFDPERLAPEWRDGFFVVPRLPALHATGPAGEAGDAEGHAAGDGDRDGSGEGHREGAGEVDGGRAP